MRSLFKSIFRRLPISGTSGWRVYLPHPAIVSACRSFHDFSGFDDSVEEDIGASASPLLGNLLGLIVRQPIDARAEHHGGRRKPVDPASIVPCTRDDIAMRIAQPFCSITNGFDAILVESDRFKVSDRLNIRTDIKRFRDQFDAL